MREIEQWLTISRTSRITGKTDFMKQGLLGDITFQEFRNLASLIHANQWWGTDPKVKLIEHGYKLSWFEDKFNVFKFEIANPTDLQHTLLELVKI